MQNRKRGVFFKGRFQRAFLLAGVVLLSMCTAVCADPAGCPQPTEIDNWFVPEDSKAPPVLSELSCEENLRRFSVDGFHPPYELQERTADTDWVFVRSVQSQFLYPFPCGDTEGRCLEIRVLDALEKSSDPVMLSSPPELQYPDSNPDEVNPNNQSAVTIHIVGGVSPYSWTASGEGFSFAAAVTTERSNTLLVTTDACGAGGILVEDACGQIAVGSIRSTNGQWVLANSCGEEIGPGGSVLAQNWCSSLQPDHYLVSPTEGWTFTKILYRVYKEPEYWNQCEKAPCEIPGYPGDPGEGYKISTRYIHKFHWECP